MEALDLDEYADAATQRLFEQLQKADVELTAEDAQQMPSMLRNGLVTARETGGEHWELAFRGALDVLTERLYVQAHPEASLLPRVAGSDLHQEDMVFVERLNLEAGGAVSLFRICPLWPFC